MGNREEVQEGLLLKAVVRTTDDFFTVGPQDISKVVTMANKRDHLSLSLEKR